MESKRVFSVAHLDFCRQVPRWIEWCFPVRESHLRGGWKRMENPSNPTVGRWRDGKKQPMWFEKLFEIDVYMYIHIIYTCFSCCFSKSSILYSSPDIFLPAHHRIILHQQNDQLKICHSCHHIWVAISLSWGRTHQIFFGVVGFSTPTADSLEKVHPEPGNPWKKLKKLPGVQLFS